MNTIQFKPDGALSFETVSALQDQIKQALKPIKDEVLVIDLSGVDKCDSAGLALLIDTISKLKKQSLSYQFTGMSVGLLSLAKFYEVESLLTDVSLGQ